MRRAAAQCLSGHHSESVVARLVHALDDPVRAVREESGAALRAHAPADKGILRAIPMSRYGRAEAALILHELGEAGAADALRDLVDEIIAAAEDLARRRQCFRDPGSVSQLLRDVLDEERHGLGCLALRLAGSLGDRDRMAIALHGLTDHRAVVRRTSRDLARSALPADLAPRLATFLVPQEDPHSPEVTVTPVTLTDLLSCPQPLVTTLVSEALALASTSGIRAEEQPMLTAIEKIVFLRSIPLFRGLSIGDLHPVAEACIFRQYSSNEAVFSLGDPASDLYIITAGEVVIEQDVAECQFRRIATLGPTQQFGEASFFTGEPRSARAVTTQSTALLSLSREPFLELGQREPHILVEMIRVLSQRLRACNVDVG